MTNLSKDLLQYYYNKKELCGHVWMQGGIGMPGGIIYDNIFNQLVDIGKNKKKEVVIIHIDSLGGSMDGGFLLYNLIRKFSQEKPVITVVENDCASAATFPFIAGDLRIMKPYSNFLIHQMRTGVEYLTVFKEQRRNLYQLQFMTDISYEFFMKNTGLTKKDMHDLWRSDRILSPEYCLRKKIIHHIFDPSKVKAINIKKVNKMESTRELMVGTLIQDLPLLIQTDILQEYGIKSIVIYSDSEERSYLDAIRVINLLIELPVKTKFIGLSAVSSGTYLISLFCNQSYLLNTLSFAGLNVSPWITYGTPMGQMKLYDQVQNKEFFRNLIIDILKKHTKIPKKIIDEVLYKRFIFTPEEARKYQMFDKIIDVNEESDNQIFKINDDLDPPINQELIGLPQQFFTDLPLVAPVASARKKDVKKKK